MRIHFAGHEDQGGCPEDEVADFLGVELVRHTDSRAAFGTFGRCSTSTDWTRALLIGPLRPQLVELTLLEVHVGRVITSAQTNPTMTCKNMTFGVSLTGPVVLNQGVVRIANAVTGIGLARNTKVVHTGDIRWRRCTGTNRSVATQGLPTTQQRF